MKKSTIIIVALAACALAMPRPALSNIDAGSPNLEIAFGLGVMQLDDSAGVEDDTGLGLNMGIRFGADNLPLGAEWRLYSGFFPQDDGEYNFTGPNGKQYNVYCEDCDYTIAGTDFSLLVNLNRAGVVNPYLGVGFLYESCSLEAETYYDDRHYGWHRHYNETWDDDGVTYLFRAGIDIRADLFYARFDASYIGEIYDTDDNGQFLLSGDLGLHFHKNVRADVFGNYFTEYKSFYIGIGVTVAL